MKNGIIALVVIILIGVGVYFFIGRSPEGETVTPPENVPTATTTTQTGTDVQKPEESIGKSVENRDIMAYHFGEGDKELLFIGGTHGGYSWNTALVAFELIDYLKANPSVVPSNLKVTVIPVLNPDGLNKVVGSSGRFTKADVPTSMDSTIPGRFNANKVDLNRNFDCDWKSAGTWQSTTVSGGGAPFSEPESEAIKNYVVAHKPTAVVVWYSAVGGVYASSCHNGVSAETRSLMSTFASASGYPSYDNFNFYEITGDMVNWFAKNNIPGISVLLTNHQDTEWTKNKAGVDALLKFYSK